MRRIPLSLVLALAWLAAVILAAAFADWLPLADPLKQSLMNMLAEPDAQRWFGADSLGRDVLSRVIYGFRITLVVSVGSVGLALLAGGTLGLCAGFFRGWFERITMACVNVMLAFPPLVLIIAMLAYPGEALTKVIIALGIVFVPAMTRLARANTLRFTELDFVTAARASGMGSLRILLRELVPNLLPSLLAYALLLLAVSAVAEAGLSFLGLGVPPPAPSLGSMMAEEQSRVMDAPHAVFFPALMLFLTIFALNTVAEHVQKRIDGRAGTA